MHQIRRPIRNGQELCRALLFHNASAIALHFWQDALQAIEIQVHLQFLCNLTALLLVAVIPGFYVVGLAPI